MRAQLVSAVATAACAACLAAPAAATLYVMVSDAALADGAAAVAEVEVVAAEPSPVPGRPASDYLVEIQRLVVGHVPGSTLIVRVPGGESPGGLSWQVWGAPRFAVGERALLFLVPGADGSYRLRHLMLGAFRLVDLGGRTYALRDLGDLLELPHPATGETAAREHQPRDYERFAAWLARRAAGVAAEPDYFVPLPAGARRRLGERFTLFHDSITGLPFRWFDFDAGGRVVWHAHQDGEPGVPGGGFSELGRGLAAWSADPRTPIDLAFGGTTGSTGGFADGGDGRNTLLFSDPNDEIGEPFDCGEGGTLAIGGPRFRREVRGSFRGQEYIRILEAEIITNRNLDCFFRRSCDAGKAAEEIFSHELGHTLGLGHSCGDDDSPPCTAELRDAQMYARVHDDCRGARLNGDDLAGARSLYEPPGGGGGGGGGPAAPGNLTAAAAGLDAELQWEDRSGNEQGYRVYRGTGGDLAVVAELPADSIFFRDPGLAPATRYEYQVGAFNAAGERRSARVALTTPVARLVSVVLDPLPGGAAPGQAVAFGASFSGPVERAVWRVGDDALAFSPAPCAPGRVCAAHIFAQPGTYIVSVEVVGDLGQRAEDAATVVVGGAPARFVSAGALVQSVIFGRRGETGTFESTCWSHNAAATPALVEYTYLPRGQGNPDPERRQVTLAAGQTVVLPNVVAGLFGAADTQGSIALAYRRPEGDGGPPDVRTFCRSFVDLRGQPGSFGQFVGEEREETWSAEPKVVTGVLQDGGFTATLLAANVDDRPGRVTVELSDAAGAPVGAPQFYALGRRTMRFRLLADLFPEAAARSGPFTARFTSDGIRFAASATLLESASEDQIFVAARPAGGANPLYVPRVATAESQFGAFLVSRLVATSASSGPTELSFELWLRGQNNLDPPTARRTLPAGGVLVVDDLIRDLFDRETGVGALKITWSNADGVAPRVVTYSLNRSGGGGKRFGMLVDSRGADTAAAVEAVDFGAEQSAVFRADFGVLNLRPGRTRVEVTLLEADGVTEVARSELLLAPQQQLERNLEGIFSQLALGEGTNWTLRTRVLSGGPVMTYLANTNVSGDIFFVPGRPADP